MPDIGTGATIGASLIGSALSGDASSSAADQQSAAADKSIALQTRMYNQNRADLAPWRTTGAGALSKLSDLLGITPAADTTVSPLTAAGGAGVAPSAAQGGPAWQSLLKGLGYTGAFGGGQGERWAQQNFGTSDGAALQAKLAAKNAPPPSAAATPSADTGSLLKDFTLADFQKDPGYDFRLQQGQQALDRAAAAKGSYLGGAALKASDRYNQDYASGEYENAFNRYNQNRTQKYNMLSGVAGTGQTAVNTGVSAGQNTANSISDLYTQQGNVNAAGTVGTSNSWSTGLGNIASMFGSGGGSAAGSYNNPFGGAGIAWN